jgi:hypothetical protein
LTLRKRTMTVQLLGLSALKPGGGLLACKKAFTTWYVRCFQSSRDEFHAVPSQVHVRIAMITLEERPSGSKDQTTTTCQPHVKRNS